MARIPILGVGDELPEKFLPGRLSEAELSDTYGLAAHNPSLRKWYAALANRYAAPARVLVMGDSNSEGTGVTVFNRRWQQLLQAELRGRFQPPGITGATFPYITASPRLTPLPSGMPTSNTGGSAASYGLGLRTWEFASNGVQSLSFTFTGDRFKIVYVKGGSLGRMAISVDGGAATVVDQWKSGGVTTGNVYDSGPITPGAHTVTITRSSGTTESLFVEGLLAFNGDHDAGVRVIDGARHGATVGTFSGSTAWQPSVQAVGPFGLCIMPWGANDSTSGTTAATLRTQLDTLITSLRTTAGFNGSILLVGMPKRGNANETLWRDYLTQFQEVADGDPDIAWLNLRDRMPDYGTTEANSLDLYYDEVHYTDKGHGWIADQIATAILPR